MPANVTFTKAEVKSPAERPAPAGASDVSLDSAAYLIQAVADLNGDCPKLTDLRVYVLARQPNNKARPLVNPSKLIGRGKLTICWAGDHQPTHEFPNIHLANQTARRTPHGREVLLRFEYGFEDEKPDWLDDKKSRVLLHYPELHASKPENYRKPHLADEKNGALHFVGVKGAELPRPKDEGEKGRGTGDRKLLGFDYQTASGLAEPAKTAKQEVPRPTRLCVITYRDNTCRLLNLLLHQDALVRTNSSLKDDKDRAYLTLGMPNEKEPVPVRLHANNDGRLVYVEHRNFWYRAGWIGGPWAADLDSSKRELGTVGELIEFGAEAICQPPNPNKPGYDRGPVTPPEDVALESFVLSVGNLGNQLAEVRA
jgi:hypothetical protein